jgi:hypothetical protein
MLHGVEEMGNAQLDRVPHARETTQMTIEQNGGLLVHDVPAVICEGRFEKGRRDEARAGDEADRLGAIGSDRSRPKVLTLVRAIHHQSILMSGKA